jgi:hypothetical protein
MKEVNRFSLKPELCMKIFAINKKADVFQLKKDELFLEIFICPKHSIGGFQHIGISVPDREEIIDRVVQQGYKCIRLDKDHSDLIFIGDKSGNLFELKHKSENELQG